MKISKSQLERWDLTAMNDWADALNNINEQAMQAIDSTRNYFTDAETHWQGAAFNAAYERVSEDHDQSRRVYYEISDVPGIIKNAATDLTSLRGVLRGKADDAVEAGLRVDDDWTVHGTDEAQVKTHQDAIRIAYDALTQEVSRLQIDLLNQAGLIRAAGDLLGSGNFIDEQSTNNRRQALAKLFHDDLLARFNVPVDPDGMTTWPKPPLSWGFGSQKMTAEEARLLDDLGLLGARDAYGIYKTAIHESENVFDRAGITDGHSDAFRHAYWNAMLANRFGPEFTQEYTNAHEGVDTNSAAAEAMDLHNNAVGRRIAAEHPDASPEELATYVKEAVLRGDMVVVGPDGMLTPSDQVAIGETGRADGPPATGGTKPPPTDTEFTSGGYNPGSDGESYGTYDS
jgi:hypothetical protein